MVQGFQGVDWRIDVVDEHNAVLVVRSFPVSLWVHAQNFAVEQGWHIGHGPENVNDVRIGLALKYDLWR